MTNVVVALVEIALGIAGSSMDWVASGSQLWSRSISARTAGRTSRSGLGVGLATIAAAAGGATASGASSSSPSSGSPICS